MKIRTLLSTALLAIVALALTAPAVGQSLSGPGLAIHWQIRLKSDTPRNTGTAEYDTFRAAVLPPATANGKLVSRFTVETITPSLQDGTKLEVYVGPSTNVNEPYGKLVGFIDVDGGIGAMVLVAAKVPLIKDGSTVSIVEHGETATGQMILNGTF